MFFSEGFAFCVFSKMYDCDIIIESGVRHGVSTRFGAELERVHINMISDRVGKKSNMFKV